MLKGASLMLITGFLISRKCCGPSLRQIKVRVIMCPSSLPPSHTLSLFLPYIFFYCILQTPRGPCTNPSCLCNHHQYCRELFQFFLLPRKRLPSNLWVNTQLTRHLSVRAAQSLKPLRNSLQNTPINRCLITRRSAGEIWAGVGVGWGWALVLGWR